MKTVDFYFDFSSTNSYFAAFLIDGVAERIGARVRWIPVHSAALFRETGFDVMAMTPRKARYLWRDHERYAARTGLSFKRPTIFPIKTSTALRMVLASGEIAGADSRAEDSARRAITQELMRAYWERDEDISDEQILVASASRAGFDGPQLIALANSEPSRTRLRAETTQAAESGIFGLPSFAVAGEIFWGKDRIDFVEEALSRLH